MDKYEISLWEDFPTTWEDPETGEIKNYLGERKIAVIGSDTMEAQARAIEPNLVEEINGSNTFTFKMYYNYLDNQTGEKYANPFGQYLVNERKVKVFWKDKWYDFVIKKCQEDSSKKSVTYTCKDLFINELSKQGYSLEFATELQNNIGTAAELAEKVLEGSTWQYDYDASTKIIQKTEGPVYEVSATASFNATKQNPDEPIEVVAGNKILVYYDSLVNLLNIEEATEANVQFLYSADGYQTDVNDMLVINGDCCEITATFSKENNYLTASLDDVIFSIDLSAGVSNRYTANRLVKSQKTEYDPVLDRYVLVCKDENDKKIYEIATTEYTNPLAIINLIANPCEFTGTSGWIGQVDQFGIFPKFGPDTEIATYKAKSYLKIKSGWTYNSGLQGNISYFTPNDSEKRLGAIGGVQAGEKFIFRAKVKNDSENAPNVFPTEDNLISFQICKYDNEYQRAGESILTQGEQRIIGEGEDQWVEYDLTANIAVSANELNDYGIFIQLHQDLWFENVQFFKYAEGITSYDEDAEVHRMNPGEVNLQSIVKPVYKYYDPSIEVTDAKDLTYLYVGETECEDYTPEYNDYEKIGTITESESNRFNILQSIAETFQAWVRFRIDHEDDGSIKIVDGVPCKYVYFVEELERDNGLSFEYGIDLKTITRSIDSDKLATKIIVNPNNNEFADNGFCSIARSSENYSKENFILNLDYFIQQNLLDGEELNKDLYSTDNNYIGYYYYLHQYNEEYDNLTDELLVKSLDLLRQTSQKKVYEQYLLAANQQIENIQADLISLAGVESWEEVDAYAKSHTNNEKVQSLLNAYAQTLSQIEQYNSSLSAITTSINDLTTHIESIDARQKELTDLTKEKHKQFNDKYTNYLMEGTWQDDEYVDDNKYYLDALKVAYTSSRPQLSYDINVLRLTYVEEYSSKVFELGDICYIQDREFFGYLPDKITPYKEKILVSKISTFFDQPEKDALTVQNYKTRFDDLFQRIAATSQSLEYSEGSYQRAANSINTNGTIDVGILQDTFDQNTDIVLNSSNQDIVWDDTGITVTDKFNSGAKTKILAGGIFITDDGGITWKNAIRGDGISTNLLTSGRINTNEIYIYDGNTPSFRWDSQGITAYSFEDNQVNFGKFVRHDKFGIYGYNGLDDFSPSVEDDIWAKATFGLTWKGFFLKNSNNNSGFEISTTNDLIITNNNTKRVQIGHLTGRDADSYGMILSNANGQEVFIVDTKTEYVKIGGWTVSEGNLYCEQKNGDEVTLKTSLNSDGSITSEYKIESREIIETIIAAQTVTTNAEGKGTFAGGSYNYYTVGVGDSILVRVNGTSETVVCEQIEGTVELIATTTNTNPIVTLHIGQDYCTSTANTSFSLLVTRTTWTPEDTGSWSIGRGIVIDDDSAVIRIGMTTIDSTGVATMKLYAENDVDIKTGGWELNSEGLFYYGTPFIPSSAGDIYPVGSIYLSVNNVNPGTLFGGTWEQIQDTFLLAAGSSYTAGSTGGQASHTHTTGNHTLTIAEMPSHTHGAQGWRYGHSEKQDNTCMAYDRLGSDAATTNTPILATGGGGAHNHGNTGSSSNMPPYLVVYMWKRIA